MRIPLSHHTDLEFQSRLDTRDLLFVAAGGCALIAARFLLPHVPISAATTLAATTFAYRLSRRCYALLALTGALFGVGIGASIHAYFIVGDRAIDGALVRHVANEALLGGLLGLACCIPLFIAAHRRPDQPQSESADDAEPIRREIP
jgi:EamA domain-containing membrane protein RarD